MARYLFVVFTKPVPGREDEFNDWYTNTHLDDVLDLGDYVSAQRFKFVYSSGEEPSREYMALYEVETDDPVETQRRLIEVVATDAMPFSPAIDRSMSVGWYFEPLTEKITHA
jgi:hypothetical protein